MATKLVINCSTGEREEIELTEEELAILQPAPTREKLLEPIRQYRDILLSNADEIISRHRSQKELKDLGHIAETTITNAKYVEWLLYKQTLRDLPNNIDLNNPIYPTKPE
jgi:hypothetical protein